MRKGAAPADAKPQAAADSKAREGRGPRGRREPPGAVAGGAMQAQNGARGCWEPAGLAGAACGVSDRNRVRCTCFILLGNCWQHKGF